MQKKIFPIILTIALLISSLVSFFYIYNLQGNAKVINYAGVVRGATQRLVKQELNGQQNDSLVEKIDGILKELQTGEGDVGLTRLNSDAFQELIVEMQREWKDLKEEIYLVRAGEVLKFSLMTARHSLHWRTGLWRRLNSIPKKESDPLQ